MQIIVTLFWAYTSAGAFLTVSTVVCFLFQLYSLFFTSAAVCLQKDISAQSWLAALTAGIGAIQR